MRAATAADMLTRPADRTPLAALTRAWQRGRLDTRALVVVRHGRARSRSSWDGDEATRPLTPEGTAQAAALVPVLAAYGVTTVVTSPWERCAASVRPYAEHAGLTLDTVEGLTQGAHAADPAPARAIAAQLVARPGHVALCTHRPVLATVVDELEEATRRWTAGHLPHRNPWLRTGEVLVAHLLGEGSRARVVAVERHRPAPD